MLAWIVGLLLPMAQVLFMPPAVHAEATAVREGLKTVYAVAGGPRNLAIESPGHIWFTAPGAGGIGVLVVTSTPDDPVVRYREEFFGLGIESEPYDLVYMGGAVWFTMHGTGQIGRIDTTTREIQVYPVPSPNSQPTAIDDSPSGEIWFADDAGMLGRLDPATGAIDLYPLPPQSFPSSRIEDLQAQNSHSIWFTLPDAGLVGNYDPGDAEFLVVPTGEPDPTGLAIDSQGRTWVTFYSSGRVGRYAPGTLTLWARWATSVPDSGPAGIVVFGPDSSREVWVANHKNGSVSRLVFSGTFRIERSEHIPLAPGGSQPWGITADANQHVWVADTGRNLIYELSPPYLVRMYLAFIPN